MRTEGGNFIFKRLRLLGEGHLFGASALELLCRRLRLRELGLEPLRHGCSFILLCDRTLKFGVQSLDVSCGTLGELLGGAHRARFALQLFLQCATNALGFSALLAQRIGSVALGDFSGAFSGAKHRSNLTHASRKRFILSRERLNASDELGVSNLNIRERCVRRLELLDRLFERDHLDLELFHAVERFNFGNLFILYARLELVDFLGVRILFGFEGAELGLHFLRRRDVRLCVTSFGHVCVDDRKPSRLSFFRVERRLESLRCRKFTKAEHRRRRVRLLRVSTSLRGGVLFVGEKLVDEFKPTFLAHARYGGDDFGRSGGDGFFRRRYLRRRRFACRHECVDVCKPFHLTRLGFSFRGSLFLRKPLLFSSSHCSRKVSLTFLLRAAFFFSLSAFAFGDFGVSLCLSLSRASSFLARARFDFVSLADLFFLARSNVHRYGLTNIVGHLFLRHFFNVGDGFHDCRIQRRVHRRHAACELGSASNLGNRINNIHSNHLTALDGE